VRDALASREGDVFKLAVASAILPTWSRRGLKQYFGPGSESMIRCSPEDGTNGFFVSCFVRIGSEAVQGPDAPISTKDKRKVSEEPVPAANEGGGSVGEVRAKKKRRRTEKGIEEDVTDSMDPWEGIAY